MKRAAGRVFAPLDEIQVGQRAGSGGMTPQTLRLAQFRRSHQHKSNGYDFGEDEQPGVSGYSFYDEDADHAGKPRKRDDSDVGNLAGVGRLLLVENM